MAKFQYLLAIMIITGFFGLAALFIFEPKTLSDFNQKNVGLMTGAIITNFSMVVGYFFGSSKGSADKTTLLSK